MGYQALLFCPEEKTARTVTQVLTELEFSVQACTEPFAAVKKLMAERFDAIVVDCENEQNATLLFKSARNSTSNQTALGVAVVEGQAGVAKAFRIGANLVLTKPINVEQAKGTLRVARGLLRKGEPAKSTAAAPVKPSVEPKPATSPSVVPPKNSWPMSVPDAVTTHPSALPPIPVVNASIASADTQDDDVLEIPAEVVAKSSGRNDPYPPAIAGISKGLPGSALVSSLSGGAGVAAAPARSTEPDILEIPGDKDAVPQKPAQKAEKDAQTSVESSAPETGPPFTFGGAIGPEASEGSKKIIVGAAAVVILVAGSYFGWQHFHSKANLSDDTSAVSDTAPSAIQSKSSTQDSSSAVAPAAISRSGPAAQSAKGKTAAPAPAVVNALKNQGKEEQSEAKSAASTAKGASKPSKSDEDEPAIETKPSTPAMVVQQGSKPKLHAAVPDAAPPSVVVATTGSGGSLTNLVADNADAQKPVLQTLNVSQGVSQGLLIKKVSPTYPQAALRMHVEGSVELMATIGKTGIITSVKTISGEPILAEAAIDAVKQWKYKPYLLNGEPVEIKTQITMKFKLPR